MEDFPKELPALLLDWYKRERRILPWREDPQPYRVWVSEIMLQQTRVDTALPYYERFLEALPTVEALAACPEERLLKLWEGLGYYSRVRNLQKAAQIVVERWDGQLPADRKALRSLPGIGDYTAGAISSIAFGLSEPAVDGNVLRICCRLLADSRDPASPKLREEYTQRLRPLYPQGAQGDFTQALMELGALVCLPNGAPLCEGCPLRMLCRAHQEGDPLRYPTKGEKKPRPVEERQVWLLWQGDKLLLHRRPKKGLLAGIWELPNSLLEEDFPLKLSLGQGHALPRSKHVFTHLEWHMRGWEAPVLKAPPLPEDWCWATVEELRSQIALPSAFRAYSRPLLEGGLK